MITQINRFFTTRIYFLPFLVLFFALISLFFGNEKINRDGVGYIIQSNLINNGQIELAKTLYYDLFFSKLLLLIHQISGLNYYYSSLLFNLLCLVGLSFSFFGILLLIQRKNLLAFCGLIVLISSLPLIDKYLSMTIRDYGMWFGITTSTYFFMRYQNVNHIKYFFLSIAFIFLASLFRTESLTFLSIPFVCILFSWFKKYSFVKLIKIIILFVSAIFAFISLLYYFYDFNFENVNQNHLWVRLISFYRVIFDTLPVHTQQLWLSGHLKDYPMGIKYSLLLNVFIQKWFAGLGLVHLILAYIGFKSNLISHSVKKTLVWSSILAILLILINFVVTLSISARYFTLHYIFIYIFSAAGLFQLCTKYNFLNSYKKVGFWLLIFGLAYLITGNLYDKPSINSEKMASEWLISKNIDIEQAYISDMRIRYYMNELSIETRSISHLTMAPNVAYLVINRNEDFPKSILNKYQPIEWFPNSEKVKITVYKLKSSPNQ